MFFLDLPCSGDYVILPIRVVFARRSRGLSTWNASPGGDDREANGFQDMAAWQAGALSRPRKQDRLTAKLMTPGADSKPKQ